MRTKAIWAILSLSLLPSCYTYQAVKISFSEPIIKTYEVPGTKDELYLKSNLWMVSTFKDAKSVIQYSDKAEGILTGKYLLNYIEPSSGYSPLIGSYSTKEYTLYAIIEIRVKDGKAYISVLPDSWTHTAGYDGYGNPIKREGEYTKEMAIAEIDALCESYYKSLLAEGVKF
jgi:hypothetical protein